jgi:Holliday junction resolvase-like predicted endonuclease
MTCKIGGVVKFAPEIKSWSQAIGLAGLNYLTKFAECGLAGAAVGGGGYMLAGLATGSLALAMPTVGSVVSNIATSFIGIFGASRVLFGANALANDAAMSKVDGAGNAFSSFGNGAIPEYGSIKRIVTGNAHPTDAMLLLYLLHLKTPPAPKENVVPKEEPTAKPKEEEVVKPTEAEPQANAKTNNGKKGEAFEDGVSSKVKGDIGEAKVIENLRAEGFTEVVQVQNKSGHGVDVIARNPLTGDVKCVEVKANSSKLSAEQAEGGEKYVKSRLDRATKGEGHYKIPPNSEQMKLDAEKAKEWLKESPKTDYEVYQVPINNVTGVTGTPKVSTW